MRALPRSKWLGPDFRAGWLCPLEEIAAAWSNVPLGYKLLHNVRQRINTVCAGGYTADDGPNQPSPNPSQRTTSHVPASQNSQCPHLGGVMDTRDQESTVTNCGLTRRLCLRCRSPPASQAQPCMRCTNIWRDVTIVPTSITSCGRRGPPLTEERVIWRRRSDIRGHHLRARCANVSSPRWDAARSRSFRFHGDAFFLSRWVSRAAGLPEFRCEGHKMISRGKDFRPPDVDGGKGRWMAVWNSTQSPAHHHSIDDPRATQGASYGPDTLVRACCT